MFIPQNAFAKTNNNLTFHPRISNEYALKTADPHLLPTYGVNYPHKVKQRVPRKAFSFVKIRTSRNVYANKVMAVAST